MSVESPHPDKLTTNTVENFTALTAWHIDPDDNPYGSDVADIIRAEREAPVSVHIDSSLRPKILDACGMTCTFCHNEGTPVAKDHRETKVPLFLGKAGVSGRVSVFEGTNGVNFLPGKMMPDERFVNALRSLRDGLGLHELHMTGGEPTLHPDLPALVGLAKDESYSVKMTSNGENGAKMIPIAAAAGLDKVNFSIFGTTPEELAAVQNSKYSNPKLAAAKLLTLRRSITAALENGVKADANIVMSDISHAERVERILNGFEPEVSLRILPDLDVGLQSHFAIYKFLSDLGARPVEADIDAGSSNARVKYVLPGGREVYFKQIRPTRLPETCASCSMNNPDDCKEGYYGIRLYVDQDGDYKVGVCLQRMDLTMSLDEFIGSDVYNDVKAMRQQDYEELTAIYEQKSN